MKKYIIFISLVACNFLFGQIPDSSFVDTIGLYRDSLKIINDNDFIKPKVERINTQKEDSLKKEITAKNQKSFDKIDSTDASVDDTPIEKIIDEGELKLTEEIKKINPFKSFSLWDIFSIIILFLLGVLGNWLIEKIIQRPKLIADYPILGSFLIYLKILIWLVIFYLVLQILIANAEEILYSVIIIAFLIVGLSIIPFVKNLVGGFFVSITNLFKKGDYITVSSYAGIVIEVNWRNTIIENEDKSIVAIPNLIFLEHGVANINKGKKEYSLNIKFNFSANYEVEVLNKLILDAAIASPFTFSKVTPKVYLVENDLNAGIRTYELHHLIIEQKFENAQLDYLNRTIDSKIKDTKAD